MIVRIGCSTSARSNVESTAWLASYSSAIFCMDWSDSSLRRRWEGGSRRSKESCRGGRAQQPGQKVIPVSMNFTAEPPAKGMFLLKALTLRAFYRSAHRAFLLGHICVIVLEGRGVAAHLSRENIAPMTDVCEQLLHTCHRPRCGRKSVQLPRNAARKCRALRQSPS